MLRSKQIKWPNRIPILETKRLTLRALSMKDAEAYFHLNSNQKVMEMYGVHRHKTLNETKKLLTWLQLQFKKKTFLRWGIIQKHDGKLIGDIGFWRFVEIRARAEIGAKLLPDFWGEGYVTEAMIAVLDHAFAELNLQSVEGNVEKTNLGSLGLMKKLGFARIGNIPRHTYSDVSNDYIDTILFNCHSEQWKGRRGYGSRKHCS